MAALWTPARDARLIEVWPKLTALEIATDLGGFEGYADKGRNNVNRRALRLGLPAKDSRGRVVRDRRSDGYIPTANAQPYRPGIDPRPARGDRP